MSLCTKTLIWTFDWHEHNFVYIILINMQCCKFLQLSGVILWIIIGHEAICFVNATLARAIKPFIIHSVNILITVFGYTFKKTRLYSCLVKVGLKQECSSKYEVQQFLKEPIPLNHTTWLPPPTCPVKLPANFEMFQSPQRNCCPGNCWKYRRMIILSLFAIRIL